VFVDLATKPMAPAELRRFSDKLKPRALVDEHSRAYQDLGLAFMRLDDVQLYERILADQRLLKLPLVRRGRDVSVGHDAAAWKAWLSAPDRD
jgi:arsenate reductase-like glutaredoxin family protein